MIQKFDDFKDFITESNRNEVLSADLIIKDDIVRGNFYVTYKEVVNKTTFKNEDFLRRKYKGLIDLFLLKQNYELKVFKKIDIKINPEKI